MGNNIKVHLEHAEKSGVCNLSKMDLNELPGNFNRLSKNLRSVDLSYNKLNSIPNYFTSFGQLKVLNASHNRINAFPNICNMLKLETVNLDSNHIPSIPATCLQNLVNLHQLTLSDNHLTSFPSGLNTIKSLDLLDLSKNKISDVREEHVVGLNVVEINLNQNQLSKLDENISKCSRLKVLRLNENCLPLATFTPAILQESNICLLSVEGNLFENKQFQNLPGYEQYMERYTATKKKFA